MIRLAELLTAFAASHRAHLNVLMLDCLGHLRVSTLCPSLKSPPVSCLTVLLLTQSRFVYAYLPSTSLSPPPLSSCECGRVQTLISLTMLSQMMRSPPSSASLSPLLPHSSSMASVEALMVK